MFTNIYLLKKRLKWDFMKVRIAYLANALRDSILRNPTLLILCPISTQYKTLWNNLFLLLRFEFVIIIANVTLSSN